MKHNESTLQTHCVTWMRLAFPEFNKLFFSVPNGGQRNATTARIMKAEGVVAGVSDLILLVPASGYHGLCIEMKTDKGRQSDHQREFQECVEAQKYKYVICRSVEDFQREITEYLKFDMK